MQVVIILFSVFILLHLVTVLVSWPAWKRTSKNYRPMLLFMFFTFLLELGQSFIPGKPFVYIKTEDVQTLMSFLLILWQAKEWHVFDKRPLLQKILTGIAVAGCIADWIYGYYFPGSFSWFYLCSVFGILLLAIEMLNRNLPRNLVPVLKDPVFLFSTGLILYFTMMALLEVFAIFFVKGDKSTITNVYYFYSVVCIFIQIIFIRSVVCIPARDKYYSY